MQTCYYWFAAQSSISLSRSSTFLKPRINFCIWIKILWSWSTIQYFRKQNFIRNSCFTDFQIPAIMPTTNRIHVCCQMCTYYNCNIVSIGSIRGISSASLCFSIIFLLHQVKCCHIALDSFEYWIMQRIQFLQFNLIIFPI